MLKKIIICVLDLKIFPKSVRSRCVIFLYNSYILKLMFDLRKYFISIPVLLANTKLHYFALFLL